jgi:ABC-type Fe3+/spermidine/putrescine transport system ATPase subunit
MSDRVAVMRHGELEQAGTPLEIYTRPRNVFVADFVGHSNVFEGVVERVGDGVRLIAGGLPFDVSGLPGAGSRAVIALPAHKVGVSRRPAAADNSLEAKVKHVSFLGSSLHLVLEMGGLTVSSELPVSEELSDLRNNDKVYAHWSKFDPIVLP